jgi:xylan 1,4-beta-xylosidase
MMDRRDALKTGALGALALFAETAASTPKYKRGPDNQRIADQGNGTFLNPVIAGDRPDPAILKDGRDYYLTFSTFDAYPGLTIWHSRDLVNWQPRNAALTRNIGSVWAPSLEKHDGRYFLYIPVKAEPNDIYVSHAPSIDGPWSDPKSLGLHNHIDPCHVVGEDGSRWLFLSGGDRVRLSADGLSVAGPVEHVYDPWRYPDTWDVEGFSPEGPKIHRHNGWFYMLTAVGGTAGPPTGHMVIAARSRSIHGPWEEHPGNPLVRTKAETEAWWSRGHASLVEAPDGSWWSIYHGYEAGFWTLGRQCLLDPVQWTPDGWFRMTGGDLSQPIAKPKGGQAGPHGLALSDDFAAPLALGCKWAFFRPTFDEAKRIRVADRTLFLKGSGLAPSSGSPLLLTAGDTSYQF